jgi:hypothetical protein
MTKNFDYVDQRVEAMMKKGKYKPALQPISNRQGQSLKEQWESLTNNLYDTLTKYDKFDLPKELGEFKFNNSFLNKVKECIEELQLVIEEKGQQLGLPFKEIVTHVSTDSGVITPDLNNDYLAFSELTGFQLKFQIIYNNYFAHISRAFKDKNYEKLQEVIDQHPSINDSKIEILSKAIEETKDTEIVNWLLENISYTEDNIYSLYRTECFKKASDNVVDALICHLSTNRGISDGIFHKAMFNQYANGRYEDAIKTFDKITKDQNTKKYYLISNPESQEYNIAVGLYYTGLCYKYLGKIKDACEVFQYIKEKVTNSYLVERVKIIENSDRELTKLQNQKPISDTQEIQKQWSNEDLLLKTSQDKDIQSLKILNENLDKLFEAFNKRVEQKQDTIEHHDYKKISDDIKTQLSKFKYIKLKELAPEVAIIRAFPNIEAIKTQFAVDATQIEKYDNTIQLINDTLSTCDQVYDLLGVNPEPTPFITQEQHKILNRGIDANNNSSNTIILDEDKQIDLDAITDPTIRKLIQASALGNKDEVQLLLDQNADPFATNVYNYTAFTAALENRKIDLAKKFILDKFNIESHPLLQNICNENNNINFYNDIIGDFSNASSELKGLFSFNDDTVDVICNKAIPNALNLIGNSTI